jgi:hypothetical protein
LSSSPGKTAGTASAAGLNGEAKRPDPPPTLNVEFDWGRSPATPTLDLVKTKLPTTQCVNETMRVSGTKKPPDYACSTGVFRFFRPELVQPVVVQVDVGVFDFSNCQLKEDY